MKKAILLFIAAVALSCNSSSDTTPVDAIIGKWIIYKAEYSGGATYNFDINGQCGAESLEMSQQGVFKPVTETYYTNEDCTTFNSTGTWVWKKETDGTYGIYDSGQTIPERNLVFLNENEIKVTEPDYITDITVIKYYRRAL